jgi:hypothetical protein
MAEIATARVRKLCILEEVLSKSLNLVTMQNLGVSQIFLKIEIL